MRPSWLGATVPAMESLRPLIMGALVLLLTTAAAAQSGARLRAEYVPSWTAVPAARLLDLNYDPGLSDEQNGERLRLAVLGLVAGDHLRVSRGRWSVNNFFYAHLEGTSAAPIRITGEPGSVITRPNAGQNVFNLGGDGVTPLRYVLLRGFEIEGGSYGLRIHWAEDLWIDQCHVHHTGAVAIGANTHNTTRLSITRCDVHNTSGTGEGIYLGANGGTIAAAEATVAMNHIHHTGGSQGDGIELKQGSYGCLIAENTIHDTQYPGVLCYGSGGQAINRIENNTVWNTGANPFQVQGEALVRGNLVFARNGPALQTAPHQGLPTRLAIVGNTFIAENGRAATISAWANEPGMVLRNNAFYARSDVAVAVNGGLAGVDVGDNVIFGPLFGVPGGGGFIPGAGLADMVDAAWDGSKRDARPVPGGALHLAGASIPGVSDLGQTGSVRGPDPSVGALESGTYGRYLGASVPGAPRLRLRAPIDPTGLADALVEVQGLNPGDRVVIGVNRAPTGLLPRSGPLPQSSSMRSIGIAGPGGTLRFIVPAAALVGLASEGVTLRASTLRGTSAGPWSRSMAIGL